MKVFHYTTPENCHSIYNNQKYSGLRPKRRLADIGDLEKITDSQIHKGVSHALLEEKPNSWINNPEYPNAWKNLVKGIGLQGNNGMDHFALLKIKIISTDKAEVVDRKYLEPLLDMKPEKITDKELTKRWNSYLASRVPINKYTGNYSIPSVLIWNTIPSKRIKVVDYSERIDIETKKDFMKLFDIAV